MESVTNARLGGLRASSPTGYKLKDVAGYLDRDLATVSSLIFALRRALPKMRTCESRPSDCGKIVQNRKSDPDPSNFYEAWSQIMQRFFRIFCDGIERFEGFVDKFTGYGGMALFGAPIAHEDHAQRACYAAPHLRDAARTYASGVHAQHGMPFAVRIG